jgi:NADPH:quinone reductase-like Zn-dependent oxidoreductase
MRAIVFTGAGGAEVMSLEERPDPVPGSDEVLVAATHSGINPADLHQRAGGYPAPPGARSTGRVGGLRRCAAGRAGDR